MAQADIHCFVNIRSKRIVTENNLLLQGTLLINPHSLWNNAVDLAHEGHQGVGKNKAL